VMVKSPANCERDYDHWRDEGRMTECREVCARLSVRSWHLRSQRLHAWPPTGRVRVVKARRKAVSKKQVAGIGMVRKLIAAGAG
jgi:hypothetical protein